ncbi:MAG: hypothetical protein AAF066_04580 [Pseudomonadota bacterium]
MRHSLLAFAVILSTALPASAEETEDGLGLMERGARMLLEGLMKEIDPALDDLKEFSDNIQPGLREFIDGMGPAFVELLGQIEDLSAYHPPEILPNGDIIIRKKTKDELAEETDDIEI